MMLKVVDILDIQPYTLVCRFNNGEVKILDVLPLIEKHKNIQGVDRMLNFEVFKTAKVGVVGEILWDDIVHIPQGMSTTLWSYDISPEFAYQFSKI